MRTEVRGLCPATVVAAALLSVLAAPALAGEAARPCCFNNTRYTGTCEVTPSGDETCRSILDYLNNASAVGRQYCGNTNVRGGWKQVACSAGSQTSAAATGQAPACVDAREAPEPTRPAP